MLELIRAMIDQLRTDGIDEKVLQKAKAQIVSSFWLSHESTSSRIGRMAKNELYFGKQVEPEEAIVSIQAVTVEDVLAMTKQLFDASWSLVALGPKEHAFEIKGIQGHIR